MADVVYRLLAEDQVSKTIEQVDSKFGDLKQGFSNMAQTLAKGGAAIAAVGVTMREAFELGEEGAQILQTAESFDFLLAKVGAAPDLLDQLRAASQGTISDMELMSSTSLLLAGAQGELATNLANATPQLLEIAKAANKLNPALGDTTFLYDSLSRGIKRASPLILDNLGLTVSLGDANERYAESIGKTVDELTEEEKKIALLNSVLEQGDVLINQVGGSVDSQTDAFQRLKASTTNLTDELKTRLVPFLADAAEGLELLLTWSERVNKALSDHEEEIRSTARTYEDYIEEMRRSLEISGKVVEETEDGIRIFAQHSHGMRDVTDQYDILSRYQFEVMQSTADLQDAVSDLSEAEKYQSGVMQELITMTDEQKEAQRERIAAEKEATAAIVDQAIATEALAAGIDGRLLDAYDSYLEKLGRLKDDQASIQEQIQSLASGDVPGYSESINDLAAEIDNLYLQNQNAIDAMREMEASGNANSELYQELADKSTNTAIKIYELEENMRSLKIEAQEAAQQGIKELTKELEENEEAQRKALEAQKDATSEFIFTKASKDLDIDATIALARAMGILSEEDYTVVASIQALREEHDLNRDGMIDASEGAFEYAGKIKALNDAVLDLQERDLPITFESISGAMSGTITTTDDLKTAMVEALGNIDSSLEITDGNITGLDESMQGLIRTFQELYSMPGISVGGASSNLGISQTPDYSTGIYSAAGTYTGAGSTLSSNIGFTINYQPTLSMADAYELERLLTPIVQRILAYQ